LLATTLVLHAAHGSQLLHVCQTFLGTVIALSSRTQVPSPCFFEILLYTNSDLQNNMAIAKSR
jgi:hypothetical protein